MRYSSLGLLIVVLGGQLMGCTLVQPGGASPGHPTTAPLPEGQGIKQLPLLTSDPRTDQVFWSIPFYWGHVGGHAVTGRAGQLPQRLDEQYKDLSGASWSKDGQRVALYVKTGTRVPEEPNSSLFGNELDTVVVSEQGGLPYRTVTSGITCGGIWLSPAGDKLLVRETPNLAESRYTVFDLTSGTQEVIPLGNARGALTSSPMWSPDGNQIALLIQRQSLVIHTRSTHQEVQATTPADALLGWTDDSQTAFVGVTDNGRALGLTAFSPEGSATATASITLPLTGTPFAPMVSPDGRKVAFGMTGVTPQGVYLADIHGGGSKQVVPPAHFLGWLDASTLLCEILKDGHLQVEYTVDVTQR